MSTFSERQGYKGKKAIQFESMDEDLRIGLWNALESHLWSQCRLGTNCGGIHIFGEQPLKTLISSFWCHHLKRRLDDIPIYWEYVHKKLREYFFDCAWNEVYDAIEVLARFAGTVGAWAPWSGPSDMIIATSNAVLERERSAYRFVGNKIAPITNEVEVKEIETALETPYDAVRLQIQSAVEKLSEKPEPDLRHCIKESIGAVETAVRLASNDPKGTLGKLLSTLKGKIGLHSAQVEGFQKLYGYTSDDESGIRHGMMDKSDLTVDDARYMLVTCSAFANYLLRLAERAEILKP